MALLAIGCSEGEADPIETEDLPVLVVAESVEMSAEVGETADELLSIANEGDDILEVEFHLDEQAEWLELNLDIDMLVVDVDEVFDVQLVATCPETDEDADYNTELLLTSNDPSLQEATVDVALNCTADGDDPDPDPDPDTDPAVLTVEVEGLPDGVDADITVAEGNDIVAELTGSEVLEELEPGEYTITADEVFDGDDRYRPANTVIEQSLEEGDEVTVTVEYELVPDEPVLTGDLHVDVVGLPGGVDHEIAVVGDDESLDLPQDGVLTDLMPGNYTIEPADVADGDDLYRASSIDVTVPEDDVAEATVEYELVPEEVEFGDLHVDVEGLPAGVDHDIEVVGDDGSFDLPQSGELNDLEVGDYTIEPSDVEDGGLVYYASPVDVTIVADVTTEATVEYEFDEPPAEGGTLVVNVSGLDAGVDHSMELVDGTGSATDVPQSAEMDVEPGAYTLEVHDAEQGLAVYTPRESSISIDVVISEDETTEVDVVYELVEALWEVQIEGLPDGTDADVDVTGGDLDTTLTETTSFDDLTPDSYDVTPNSVIGPNGQVTYDASAQTVDVASGDNDPTTITYEEATGTLNVIVSGLSTADADIVVRDEQGETVAELDGSQIISDLSPGSYTIDPQPVDENSTTYTAAAQTRDVLSNATTDVQITYQDSPGELELSASGLPDGAQLRATVDGPSDYTSDVTGAQTVTGLEGGDYTITFNDVDTDAWTTYSPEPVEVEVTVTSDTVPEATTDYERVDGELELAATDVPDTFEFEATVTGPDSYSETFSGDQVISDLVPGEYVVTYDAIETDQWTTYEANPGQQTVDVESGTPAAASTVYELIDSGLGLSATGLPGNLELAATVEGPDGYSETFSGGQTIGDLTPGEYTVTFEEVDDGGLTTYEPDPEEVVVGIESGDAPNVSTHYTSVDGTIEISASGLPDDVELEAIITGPNNYSNTVSGETTLEGLLAGEYTVTFQEVDDGALATYEPAPEQLVVELESGDTFDASTSYDVIVGGIALNADGLPDALALEANITGPDGYSDSFTGEQTVGDLVPGEYTVTFESVEDGSAVYSADPTQIGLEIASGQTEDATTTYEAIVGGLEVTVDFPAEVQEFTIEIVDDNDNVVESADVSNGFVGVFDDLDAVEHTVELNGSVLDQWSNEYSDLDGFDEPQQVNSGEITPVVLTGTQPTLVRTEADSGAHSLREIVGAVNPESTITFAEDIDNVSLQSQIDVEESLTIRGNDNRRPVIEATGDHRVFYFAQEADDVVVPLLNSLTVSGGDVSGNGGAIYADSDLILFEVTLENNMASGNGGAIYAADELTLIEVTARNNQSEGDGGAVLVRDYLLAIDVEFSDNVADSPDSSISWGGAIHVPGGGVAFITEGVFRNNYAQSSGGAIMVQLGADELYVDRSLFDGNTSGSNGGAIRAGADTIVDNTTFYGNHADGNGGAIQVQWEDNTVDLDHVTMVENTANNGPAIHWDGGDDTQVWLGQSLIADNGSDQSELFVSDEDEQILSDWDNVVTAVDDQHFAASSSWDQTGTVANPLNAHLDDGLAYNGGHPQTVSVSEESPAYGYVFSGDCHSEDQRGYSRPAGEDCTAGAWEPDPNLEDFEELTGLANSYDDGSFTGNDGIVWYYEDAKNAADSSQDNEIDGKGLILRGDEGRIGADNIPGGVDALQLQYRKAYTSSTVRQFEVLIDGAVVDTSPEFGTTDSAEDTVYTMEIDNIGVSGEFDVEIRHLVPGTGAQVTFDNIRWE